MEKEIKTVETVETVETVVTKKKKNKELNNMKRNAVWWIATGILFVYCLTILYVMYWLITNSLKSYTEYVRFPYQFPKKFKWDNYKEVFEYMYVKINKNGQPYYYRFEHMVGTSVLFGLLMPLPGLLWTSCMAYVICTYKKFWYNKVLYELGVLLMVMPLVGTLPASMKVAKFLGTYDNLFMTLILNTGSFSGMRFLMLYATFKGVSTTYKEACLIDGGNDYIAFFKIALPMALPTIIVFYFMDFIAQWNSYEQFLIWFPSYANLSYGMYIFQNNISLYGVGYPTVLAGFVIVAVPSVLLYMAISSKLVENVKIGGLKG